MIARPTPPDPYAELLSGVSTIFKSLGRALVCLDRDFRVAHAADAIDDLVGEGTAKEILGRPIDSVLGTELFGPNGALRRAVEAGGSREGWGATLTFGSQPPRRVSVTLAPLHHEPGSPCDPRVAYLLVLRPAEEDRGRGAAAPTLFSGLLARSPRMLHIFQLIEKLHESDATVLVTGESGTGKELIARAIHLHSHRSSGPFVAVNCGALPGELLESELFGHVRGAFTGAVRDRTGRFEAAVGGTLFLDEIGDVPLHLQVKLLRMLQERTFERVGESTSRQSDSRIIAATNLDLRRAVALGHFREDLFYRLRVLPIEVPPLRARREDIEPLARHLLDRVAARHGRSLRLAPDAMRALLRYEWPGNVRELENALEFAVAVCQGQTIHIQDLPVELLDTAVSLAVSAVRVPEQAAAPATESSTAVEDPERETVRAALDANRWRRTETATALGMSRTTLWRKMREFGWIE